MKRVFLWIFLSCFIVIYAKAQEAESTPSVESLAFQDEDGSSFSDPDFEAPDDESTDNVYTSKMLFLDAVSKHFWNPKRKLQDNNLNIIHRDGDTHKIRTRYAMISTIIFDDDRIADFIVGDEVGFDVRQVKNPRWNLSNILTIKPKIIGVETNLTVIGESGTIYTFYVFSTHFTNRRDPAFTVFVSKDRKIGKIGLENLQDSTKSNHQYKLSEVKKKEKDFDYVDKKGNYRKFDEEKSPNSARALFASSDRNKYSKSPYRDDFGKFQKPDFRKNVYAIIEEDDGEFLTIGDSVNKLYIEKSKIQRGYAQKPKKNRSWKTLGFAIDSKQSIRMQAIDIFNDNDYTYFKFDRENSDSKFPVIFKVVDGYDNPVNTKIVGNYIIAEDLSEKWTLRIGDEWVCVQRLEKPIVVRQVVRVPQSINFDEDFDEGGLDEIYRQNKQNTSSDSNDSQEVDENEREAQIRHFNQNARQPQESQVKTNQTLQNTKNSQSLKDKQSFSSDSNFVGKKSAKESNEADSVMQAPLTPQQLKEQKQDKRAKANIRMRKAEKQNQKIDSRVQYNDDLLKELESRHKEALMYEQNEAFLKQQEEIKNKKAISPKELFEQINIDESKKSNDSNDSAKSNQPKKPIKDSNNPKQKNDKTSLLFRDETLYCYEPKKLT